jgi:hypothetical protein
MCLANQAGLKELGGKSELKRLASGGASKLLEGLFHDKPGTNKKRPGSFRITERPNSPPPELLIAKIL